MVVELYQEEVYGEEFVLGMRIQRSAGMIDGQECMGIAGGRDGNENCW